MPEDKKAEEFLAVSVSPHLRDPSSTSLIMWTVVIALIPPGAVGLYAFGWRILLVAAASVLSALVTELICLRLRGKKPSVADGSAFVTGLLLAYVLPPNVKWYVPVVGSVFAIAFGKQIFGGLGCNFFNPALLGRAFVQFAFPLQVNLARWPVLPPRGLLSIFSGDVAADAVTGATALNLLKGNPGLDWAQMAPGAGSFRFGIAELFLGHVPGCIGETSALAILLGASFLIYYKLIDWRLPLAYIASAALFLWLLPARGGAALPGGVYARLAVALAICLVFAAAAGFALKKTGLALTVRLAAGLGLGAGLFAGWGLGGSFAWGLLGAAAGLAAGLGGGYLAYRSGVDRGARGVVGTLPGLFLLFAIFGACAFGGADHSAETLKLGRLFAHVLGGGLLLGAFFMITDMVTSPMTSLGRVIMGIGAGVLVCLIRNYGAYPEGVCYSILIMNSAVPIIDRFTVPRVFGAREKK